MHRPQRAAAAVALTLALAFGFPALCAAQLVAGSAAPDMLGTPLNGKPVRVSDHAGKVVVATFWASWCPACRTELPMLEGLQRAAGPEQMKVVAISIDKPVDFRRAAGVLQELQLTITHDSSGDISAAYGRQSIPHLVVIGRDGRIRRTFIGYSEQLFNAVIAEINAALAVKAPSPPPTS